MSLPRRLEDLDAEWFSETLRGCGVLGGGRVTSVGLDPMGTFSSQLVRARLRYDEAAVPGEVAGPLPERLVLKCSLAGHPDRGEERFASEIRFYRELAPRIPARVPRFLHGEIDEGTGRGVLLLAEVPGVAETDWLHGPDDQHARLAVSALARMHAAFLRQVDRLDWIPHFEDPRLLASFERSYARSWLARRDFLLEIVPAARSLGDGLVGQVAASHARLGDDATLLHGDAHAENMPLADARDGAGGREVVLLDWAAVRRGSAGVDLGFFIPMSFPAERRGGVERSLVALHAGILAQHGVRWCDDPWLAYRRGVLRRFARIVEIADGWDASALSGLRMVFHRCATAAVDLCVEDLVGGRGVASLRDD